MKGIKHTYFYDGPVIYFDRCILNFWYAETTANSEQEARNNLTYRFKKQNNMSTNTNIKLPGKLMVVT